MKTKTKNNIRIIAGCGMLTAVAVILQYIEFAIPFIPAFIKLDFSDLPEILGSFAYGPIAGVTIALLKNLIHMLFSQSGFVGELSNFILGAIFALVAGLVYKLHKTKIGALTAGVMASFVMALASIYSNLFLIYPLYYNVLGFPEEAVLGMYQAILPSMDSISMSLIVFNVPFTFVKGLICVVIAMFIYKPLSKVLKGKSN